MKKYNINNFYNKNYFSHHSKIFFSIFLLFFFVFQFFAPLVIYAECSESNAENYLVCEDWDSDNPPHVNWPCGTANGRNCNQSVPGTCCYPWHGWTCTDSIASDDEKSQVTTERAHSGTRSLRETSQYKNGERPATDIYHSIPGSPSVVYIRFYVYVENFNDIAIGHFIFMNTASYAEAAIDWRDCTDQTYRNCGGMYLVVHSYGPEVWLANNNQPQPFNFLDHKNEWVLVEVKFDFANDKAEIWINGIKYVNNWSVSFDNTEDFDFDSAHTVIISGWRSLGTSNDQSYWIDDFVVNTSYIGPRQELQQDTTPPAPPTNLRVD